MDDMTPTRQKKIEEDIYISLYKCTVFEKKNMFIICMKIIIENNEKYGVLFFKVLPFPSLQFFNLNFVVFLCQNFWQPSSFLLEGYLNCVKNLRMGAVSSIVTICYDGTGGESFNSST